MSLPRVNSFGESSNIEQVRRAINFADEFHAEA